jgi:hypothetical protein
MTDDERRMRLLTETELAALSEDQREAIRRHNDEILLGWLERITAALRTGDADRTARELREIYRSGYEDGTRDTVAHYELKRSVENDLDELDDPGKEK